MSSDSLSPQLPSISTDTSEPSLPYCEYCGLSDENTLVRCHGKDCGRWFCNNKHGLSGSHIFLHLRTSNHREISPLVLQYDLQRLPASLRCEKCGQANVFYLSIIEFKRETMLLCSNSCMNKKQHEGHKRLAPAIEENMVSNHIVKCSRKQVLKKIKKLSLQELRMKEVLWKNCAKRAEDDEVGNVGDECVPQVQDSYESITEYKNTFTVLVGIEEAYHKEKNESWTQCGVKVSWQKKNQNLFGYLHLSNEYHFGGNLNVGDQLIVKSDVWCMEGTVKSAHKNEKICVVFTKGVIPVNPKDDFMVKLCWINTTFRRMREGLQKLVKAKPMSSELYSYVLGSPDQQHQINFPSLEEANLDFTGLKRFDLNEVQVEAAKKAMRAPSLFLIQGPPGTGKTLTLIAIITQMLQDLWTKEKDCRFLICAPSNIAVDYMAEKLIEYGASKVCRMFAQSREKIKPNSHGLKHASLHMMIQARSPRLKHLLDCKERGEALTVQENQEISKLKQSMEEQVLQESRIVCCTCISAGDARLKNFEFKYVFIDEAAQATEPECILPWLLGAKKVILAGDHKQIGPIISSAEAVRAGLSKTLFERLISQAEYHVLKFQYRMHPLIAKFPSLHFYEDKLVTHKSVRQRPMNWNFPWPNKNPVFFYHIEGKEEIPAAGISFLNREEAVVVRKMVERLIESGIKPQQIGVITPYNGQKGHLIDIIESRKEWKDHVEIASVDGFQGREKDYIIISCVRSNRELGVGFLNDERRLNVALTRAKYGMIICGNAKVLSQDADWMALMRFYNNPNQKLIFEGELGRLKPIDLDLLLTYDKNRRWY